jgi:hypothetical protein
VRSLDEIQKIPAWSETVKRLWDEDTRKRLPLEGDSARTGAALDRTNGEPGRDATSAALILHRNAPSWRVGTTTPSSIFLRDAFLTFLSCSFGLVRLLLSCLRFLPR